MEGVRERRHGQDCGSQQRKSRDRPRAWRGKLLQSVAETSGEEREPKDEQAVGQDRSDQRRLDDPDQPLVQGKQRHEQLGKIAERRLDRSRTSRPKSAAELFGGGAHEAGKHRERNGGGGEAQNGIRAGEIERSCDGDQSGGDHDLELLSPRHACAHRATLSTRETPPPKRGTGGYSR